MTECPFCMGDSVNLRARVTYPIGGSGARRQATVKLYDATREDVEVIALFCRLHRVLLAPDDWMRDL